MATVKDFEFPDHAYDAPDLSPKEFLLAIMHDQRLPISVRMQAAHDVAPFILAAPKPKAPEPTLTIVIQPSQDPDPDNTNRQSNSASAEYKRHVFMTTPGPSYIEKTLERIPLSEIIEIVSRTPEHLLPTCTICNYPMMYPCSVTPNPPPYTDPSSLPCVTRHTPTGETVH